LASFWQPNPGHGLPLRFIDRGSDARTLAKEASGPMEGGMGYESPIVDWMQMPGADMTQPNSWNGIFTDILSNE
jgi:hypothetical protein